MNWEAIGAVGEIVGALGVIVTLAYLAVQIHQNSHQLERSIEATRVAAEDAVSRGFDRWREMVAVNPELSDIYLRGLSDLASLTPAERHRFNFVLSSFGWTSWQMWRAQSLMGTPNTELFRDLFCHPGAREWYGTHRQQFPLDFRAALDDVLSNVKADGITSVAPHEPNSMFAGALAPPVQEEAGGES